MDAATLCHPSIIIFVPTHCTRRQFAVLESESTISAVRTARMPNVKGYCE